MDKNQIKKFSQYARSTLIPEMQQAISIWENASIVSWWVQIGNHSYNDSLSLKYSSAVTSLKKQIDKKWEKALAEEAAYIWFNRIVALRFMEVNKYLPTRSSLFASDDDTWIPEIVKNIDSEWNNCGCDKDAINQYILKYDTQSIQELYGLILVSICNKLSEHYWFMFSKIDDWTALLFPRTILNASHILRDKTNWMLNIIDENRKEVEIIWWIYQYYISERKDELITASRKNNKKFWKDELWPVTQLFTPNWIVKYMVHNTVWKTWVENFPKTGLKEKWKYLIDTNYWDYVKLDNPLDLTLLDPACWSGHILVEAFNILFDIYLSCWYLEEQIPELIIKHNLYWFEIDERAHQLACFAVLMKAKKYDKNIEKKVNILDHIICIEENNSFESIDEKKYPQLRAFIKLWYDSKISWSLIKFDGIEIDIDKVKEEYETLDKENWLFKLWRNDLKKLIHQYNLMNNYYVCVVTNPPYMWVWNMDLSLRNYILKNYEDVKYDLFAPFIVRCLRFLTKDWFAWFMTPNTWMFIDSYINLRNLLLSNYNIDSLIQLENSAFEEAVVAICTFTIQNTFHDTKWSYVRLSEFKGGMDIQNEMYLKIIKEKKENFFNVDASVFKKIPKTPLSYWINDAMIRTFESEKIWDCSDSKSWICTWNDQFFIKFWYEVNLTDISFWEPKVKWDYQKYHQFQTWWEFRRRYGNLRFVIALKNLYNDSLVTKSVRRSDPDFYFKSWVCRSYIWSNKEKSFRIMKDSVNWTTNPVIFPKNIDNLYYIIWLLNTKYAEEILYSLNPTLSLKIWDIENVPFIINNEKKNDIDWLVKQNIDTSKQDWNSFETSWDFKRHPLLEFKWNKNSILDSFIEWRDECKERAQIIKDNEEVLNKIFNKIYWVEWEIDPSVNYDNINIWKADNKKDIQSMLSYMVWCMLWRYSLDYEWLVYAWWEFDKSKYKTFKADDDGIIPILDKDYSDDDIVERTKEFVKKVWWENTLNENLNWIAESLDPESNKTADQVIRDYYNKEFYDDHCQIYQKRPIYWLFVSNPSRPKDSAFKALVYMHRYSASTIQDLRRNYVQSYQQKLIEERSRIENNNDKTSQKRVAEIDKINTELTAYANKLKDFTETHQWTIDLDDWVKVNYWMFMDAWIVAKIKL